MNLEQKGVEILFPLNSAQGISLQNKLRTMVKRRKETSKTGRLSTRGGKKKDDCNLLPGTGENLKKGWNPSVFH